MFCIKKLRLTLLSIVTTFITGVCQTNEPNQISQPNGTTGGYKALELLKRGIVVMREADGMLISFSSSSSTPTGIHEMSIDIQNSGALEVRNRGSTFEARAEIMQNLMGSEIKYVGYFKEDSLYVDLGETDLGLKIKHVIKPENAFSLINVHLEFSEDAIVSQTVAETDEGTQLSFALNDESLLKVIKGHLNGAHLALEQLDTTDYKLVVMLNDDQMIKSVNLQIHLTYEENGKMFEISMNTSLEISLADHITFKFQGDPDEFMELGEGSLPIF